MNEITISRKKEKFESICAEIIADIEKYGNITWQIDNVNYKIYLFPETNSFTSYFLYEYMDKHIGSINYIIALINRSEPNIEGRTLTMIISIKTFA